MLEKVGKFINALLSKKQEEPPTVIVLTEHEYELLTKKDDSAEELSYRINMATKTLLDIMCSGNSYHAPSLRLAISVAMAQLAGVEESKIIHNLEEANQYFTREDS